MGKEGEPVTLDPFDSSVEREGDVGEVAADVIAKAESVPEEERTEEWEQALRDKLGYTATEKRTKAERDAAAARMIANTTPNIELPPDIAKVWTGESALTAKVCIEKWGVETFRSSRLHQEALSQIERRAEMPKERVIPSYPFKVAP